MMKLWPLYAISMPHELAWQRFTCWRCKGTGKLPDDDPYVRPRPTKTAVVSAIWFWAFAGSTLFIIIWMLWP